MPNEISTEQIKRVLCSGCTTHCGLLVKIKDGQIVSIKGDPSDPLTRGHICEKGMAAPKLLYHRERLKYPLKRTGERGEGKWTRISWKQAIDEIAKKIEEIKRKYGPEAIALIHGSSPRYAEYIQRRFMNLLGSPNVFSSASQVCWDNTAIIECITYGWMAYGDIEHTQCIVEWGSNPACSHLPRWRSILKAKKRGAKLIVIDPRLTKTAAKADIWLQIRPGTDCALALGWLNVIINEELYDKDFVKNWTIGFEKLKERVQEYPPEKVSEITHIPAEKIRESARIYATTKPAIISWGVSLDHIGKNASQAIRARAILRAITGNLDVRGGEILCGLHPRIISETEIEENEKLSKEQKEKLLGTKRFKLLSWNLYDQINKYAKKVGYRAAIPSYSLVNAHTPTVWRAIITGEPYPVKAVICQDSNPLLTCANTKLVYRAIKELELFVVHDIFMTPTAMLADYALPAVTWLERSHMDHGVAGNYVKTGEKVIEPMWECRTDFDFLRELGIKLGQEWPWKNLEELYEYRLKPLGYSWKDFVTKIRWDVPPFEYKRYEKRGFATPSGKVEIYSTILEKLGYDPLPKYEEPAKSPISASEKSKKHSLVLITGGRLKCFHHSEGRQIDMLRKIHPEPLVQIHPKTAEKLGIKDGDWVWIETHLGKIKQKTKVDPGVPLNIVHAEHGWWFPEKPGEEPTLYGLWESNINVIIDDNPDKCDPMIGSWQLRAIRCKIYKV